MTIAQCVSYCNSLGFFLAGLAQGLNLLIHLLNYRDFCLYFFKFRAYCGCGQSLKYAKDTDTSCTYACNGDPINFNEYCGGLFVVSVYSTGNYTN